MANAYGPSSPNGRWQPIANYSTSSDENNYAIYISNVGMKVLKNNYSSSNWYAYAWADGYSQGSTHGTSKKGGNTGTEYWSGLTGGTYYFARTHSDYTASAYYAWKNGGDIDPATVTGAISITVSAKSHWTLSYNKNCEDTVTNMPADDTKWYNETLTLSSAVPVRDGYWFGGWAASSSGTTPITTWADNNGGPVYAIWIPAVYTLTFDANGGTFMAPQVKTVNAGNTFAFNTVQTPSKSGCYFVGWGTYSTDIVPEYNGQSSYTPNTSKTWYAIWKSRYESAIVECLSQRTDSSYAPDDSGVYAKMTFSAVGGRWLVDPNDDSSWTATTKSWRVVIKDSDETVVYTGTNINSPYNIPDSYQSTQLSFSLEEEYTVYLYLTESYGSVFSTELSPFIDYISQSEFTLDINANGDAIALFAPAPDNDTGLFVKTHEHGFIGEIKMYAGSTAPSGWLFCRGQAVSRETYADLFDVIGTTYGSGDGSTTFNLPNFNGRMPVGSSSTDTDFSLGNRDGAKGAWKHSHQQHPQTRMDVGGSWYVPTSGQTYSNTEYSGRAAYNTYESGSDNNTLDADKANMPPYQTINFIISY